MLGIIDDITRELQTKLYTLNSCRDYLDFLIDAVSEDKVNSKFNVIPVLIGNQLYWEEFFARTG